MIWTRSAHRHTGPRPCKEPHSRGLIHDRTRSHVAQAVHNPLARTGASIHEQRVGAQLVAIVGVHPRDRLRRPGDRLRRGRSRTCGSAASPAGCAPPAPDPASLAAVLGLAGNAVWDQQRTGDCLAVDREIEGTTEKIWQTIGQILILQITNPLPCLQQDRLPFRCPPSLSRYAIICCIEELSVGRLLTFLQPFLSQHTCSRV